MFSSTYNLIHNNKVIIHRYISNRGEAIVIFDLSFIKFNFVLDLKYLNYCGVQIDNYTQNFTIEKWSDFKSVSLCTAKILPIYKVER
jgi:hypothetical protein